LDRGLGELGFDLDAVVAEGGVVERVAEGARAVWNRTLPLDGLRLELRIPPGVTMVDARLTWPADAAGIALLPRESSPLRRCPRFEDLTLHGLVCRGLTVLDPLPATWTFDLAPLGAPAAPVPFVLEATLTSAPLDGPAALLHLDALSRPALDPTPTEHTFVPASSDGALLWVEVTRPGTEARVPAILISSPYNNAVRAAGERPYDAVILDYVPRGYAVVVADVRGFGNSAGCVDVWGPREQQDQYDLVEWVAAQPWSDGKVAMYGQSYVGTTPHEAAVMQPPHLTTIVTVAGLTDPYFDWHFGGVPNGEQLGSPLSYEQLGAETPTYDEDRVAWAELVAQSYCDAVPFTVRANDPRAVYDQFYMERNLSARVGKVQVPVLYTQGYLDRNVKSTMALGWFNDLDVPKKGLFGPWLHRHPPRPDQDLYFHAWFDQWLQGRDTGILATPTAEALTMQGTLRAGDAWPPAEAQPWALELDAREARLREDRAEPDTTQWVAAPGRDNADANRYLDLVGAPPAARVPDTDGRLPFEGATFELAPIAMRRYVSGEPALDLTLEVAGAPTTYVGAWLFEKRGDELLPITFGMANAALRNGYDRWEPVPPDERVHVRVPMLPTEYALEPGARLLLEVRAAFPSDWELAGPNPAGLVTLHTGDGQSVLSLPTLAEPGDAPAPAAARVT
jgi:hypothetical protein